MDPILPAEPPPLEQPGQNVALVPVPVPNAKAKAREELIGTAIYLGIALVLIGIVFAILKMWTRRQTENESPTMSLSSYHEMYENEELSEEEYQKIRAKMAAKMKKTLGIAEKKPLGEGAIVDLSKEGTLPTIEPKPGVGPSGPTTSTENPN